MKWTGNKWICGSGQRNLPSGLSGCSALAIVLVAEDDSVAAPYYIRRPFDREPGWGVSSVNYDLKALLERSVKLET